MATKRFGAEFVITEKGIAVFDKMGVKLGEVSKRTKVASKSTKELGDTAKVAGGKASGFSASWGSALKVIGVTAGIGLAIKGLRGLVRASGEWIALSNVQEDSTKALNAALTSTGQFTDALSQQYQDMASAFQAVTTTGDEALLPMMGQLVSVGGVQRDQMKGATQAALDLSAGLRIDLNTAFLMVSKAASGNTETLGRYGLQVTKTGDVGKDFAQVLDLIGDKFGGQAQAQAQTFSGKMATIGNTLDDTREKFGDALKQGLDPFVSTLGGATKQFDAFIKAASPDIVSGISLAFISLSDAVLMVVKGGGAIARSYSGAKVVFAELLELSKPIFEMAAVWEKLHGNKETAQFYMDLAAGVEANTADQWALHESVVETTGELEAQAQSLRNQLVNALGEASTGEKELASNVRTAAAAFDEQSAAMGLVAPAVSSAQAAYDRTTESIKAQHEAHAKNVEWFNKVATAAQDTEAAVTNFVPDAFFERAKRATQASDDFAAAMQNIGSVTQQIELGSGETFDIDKDDPRFRELLENASNRASKSKSGGGKAAIEAAMNLIRQGDVGGLETLTRSTKSQADVASKIGLNTQGADNLSRTAGALTQLLGELRLLTRDSEKKNPLGFARGGTFGAGQRIRVGEEGPEEVTFGRAGTVHPNRGTMGGGSGGDKWGQVIAEEVRALRRTGIQSEVNIDGRASSFGMVRRIERGEATRI